MKLSDESKLLLRDIVQRCNPSMLNALELGFLHGFSPEHVPALRDLVGAELAETGVTNGEINQRGIMLDALIGKIGPLP